MILKMIKKKGKYAKTLAQKPLKIISCCVLFVCGNIPEELLKSVHILYNNKDDKRVFLN